MKISRRAITTGLMMSMVAQRAAAQSTPPAFPPSLMRLPPEWPPREVIRLWPDQPPGATGYKGTSLPLAMPASFMRSTATPTLNVFRPDRPTGQGVLVTPGGGYAFVSISNEGVDVAKALNPLGVTVFVLSYRLPGEGWEDRSNVPLQDAQRAMRIIRSRAKSFGVNGAQIGCLGFSAGGHLAATLATDHQQVVYAPIDAADREDARPAFAGLIYPVIEMDGPKAHGGSRDNLLGSNASAALRAARSPALRVSAQTPPCFLVHGADDTLVPIENSFAMYDALRRAGTPCEAHFLQNGAHGFGVGETGTPASEWPRLFQLWAAKAVA
jgi:acetyl esterase/lipase